MPGCETHPRFCNSWFLDLMKSGLWKGLPVLEYIKVAGKLESRDQGTAVAKVFMVISLSGSAEGQPC